MSEDWRWLIGLMVTAALAVTAALRSVYTKMSTGDRALHKRIDDIKENYVPKDHLETHMDGLKREINLMREDSRERHKDLKSEQAAGMNEIKELVRQIQKR